MNSDRVQPGDGPIRIANDRCTQRINLDFDGALIRGDAPHCRMLGLRWRRFRSRACRRNFARWGWLALWALVIAGVPRVSSGETPSSGQPSSQSAGDDLGLIVLYTFEQVSGDRVRDQSGFGKPLDLKIEDPGRVKHQPGSLHLRRGTVLRSEGSAKKIVDAVKQSGELTIEAWLTPDDARQSGPARIVSLSNDPSHRNFTLGQEKDRWDVRLRTSLTNPNGIPSTQSPPHGLASKGKRAHVVCTRGAAGDLRIYLDGKMLIQRKVAGKLGSWDASYRLLLGNEQSGDRPWLGKLHRVALYQRSLTASEIKRHFLAGPSGDGQPEIAKQRAQAIAQHHFATEVAPLLARRCLECHDASTHKGALDLSRRQAAMTGGESGPVIVPGNASQSILWDQVSSGDMPPQGDRLSPSELQTLRQWIDKGAVWSVDPIDPSVYSNHAGASVPWVQRLTIDEYIETVRSALGVDISDAARKLLPEDLRADGFRNTAYNLTVDLKHVQAYAQLAQMIVQQVDIAKFSRQFSESRSLNTDASARELVAKMGQWVLRGPLDEREVTNYCGILTAAASAGSTFDQGIALLIEAMLQSPRFIYRMEQQPADGTSYPLPAYELASRISYILWGAPPDKTLYRAAERGELTQPQQCLKQVQRMLDDPRTVNRSRQFVTDWLDLDRLQTLRPHASKYPHWDPELGSDMRRETLDFFEHVAWHQKRPLSELFNAQVTFASPRLAEHYGLKPQGKAWAQYDLTDVPLRGGLLTQGSVLTIGGDDASMVTRGLFVLKNVLRGVIGAPPPGVDTTPVPAKAGLSLRQIAQQRIDNVACGGCHSKFEPLAFGLEPYDGLGVAHDHDAFGNRLRSDGQILVPNTAQPLAYETPSQMMDQLAASDRVSETITWKVVQFSLGRPLGPLDAAAVQRVHQQTIEHGGTYRDLLSALVMSDLVQQTTPVSATENRDDASQ